MVTDDNTIEVECSYCATLFTPYDLHYQQCPRCLHVLELTDEDIEDYYG